MQQGMTAIQKYLDTLPECMEEITISFMDYDDNNKNRIDLSRFVGLNKFSCIGCNLTTLPILPDSVSELDCSSNKITEIIQLPNNLTLIRCFGNAIERINVLPPRIRFVNCMYNNLTTLPIFPDSMEELYCSHNHITELGRLTENNVSSVQSFPPQLQYINCAYNDIQILPEIPSTVIYFQCNNNPIYQVIKTSNTNTKIIDNANIIHKFRFTYYIIKFKSKFKKWLWEYVREPRIRNIFSPENIFSKLSALSSNNDNDIDSLLTQTIRDFENKLYNTV